MLLHAIDEPPWRAERRGGTLSIIILRVVVGAALGRSEELVLLKRSHKLGDFLGRECVAAFRRIGGGSGVPGNRVSGFGYHANIIAPDRCSRLRLSQLWLLLGQSDSLIPGVLAWKFCSRGCHVRWCKRFSSDSPYSGLMFAARINAATPNYHRQMRYRELRL